MPIIARVGRKHFATRALIAGIYAALILGAVTMLYPFMLMVATSTTGEPDVREFRLIPRFWLDRGALYQRYAQEKYQSMADYSAAHPGQTAHAWNEIQLPPMSPAAAEELVAPWREFVATLTPEEYTLWYVGKRSMPGKTEMLWRTALRKVYKTPEELSAAFGQHFSAFTEAFAPYERPQGRLWPGVSGEEGRQWRAFKASIDPKYRRPVDGTQQWREYLNFKYKNIDALNNACGQSFNSFSGVPLPVRLPSGGLAGDWEQFVRGELGFRFLGIDGGSEKYRAFLFAPGITLAQINARYGTHYESRQAIAWPPASPTPAELNAVSEFIRTSPPAGALSIRTPDLRYAEIVASARGPHARPPYVAEDVVTFAADASSWRWWALTRNYGEVIDYIAVRGRSLWNTVFFVGVMVLASVTVNPLAAYALSRFRLSAGNQILTFLLATMAFPGEITMIPNFLLLRHFPIWSWIAGLIVGGLVIWQLGRGGSGQMRWLVAGVLGVLAGFFAGAYLTPWVGRLIGVDLGPISLLNTFPALILPRLANGFGIFLLKGFFDSLPEEVFEAGRIDGAGELRMLWQIAIPMSTPILAVIVLQTFMAVYGSYLWALVVCQDDSMWTLMVHIFQLQQWAPPYLTMAAAVICSIPTLLVFLFAQNVIMRGVVLPSYK